MKKAKKERKVKTVNPEKEAKKLRRRQSIKRTLRELPLLIIGATLTAVATKYVYDPAELVTGGVSGLSIIAKSVGLRYYNVDIPLWMGSLIFNIPIFLYAIKQCGIKHVLRTGFVWAVLTAELYFMPDMSFIPDNLLLVSIYGSILMGVGSGMLLSARATSGGSDMLGEAMHRTIRSVSVGRLIQIIDGLIVALGLVTFGIEHTLYAIISVYIMGRVIDIYLHKGKSAKMATIISEKNDEIAQEIMTSLDRGVTGLYGSGMYTGKDKRVLLCICSNKDLVEIKDIVKKHDPKAFFVVGNVDEAMGEGFLEEWY
ncbi:MAG: YitT family protein [Lachnospiraceae bacterium]|nr:YitT family protein [Lachnospiraceae bacterium]